MKRIRSSLRTARGRPRDLTPFALVAAAAVIFTAGCAGTPEPPGGGKADSSWPTMENVPEEHLSRAIAVVNGVTVYEATYDEILTILRERIPEEDPDSVDHYISAKATALEKAIEEELLLQEALRRGYDPSPQDLRSAYSEAVAKAGSEETYLASARARRISKSELLYSFRRALALDGFLKREIEPMISITDEEVRAIYDTKPDLFTPDPWVSVAQIFVAASIDATLQVRARALSKITSALEKMQHGRSFESVALEDSEDPTGRHGGALGWFKKGNLPEKLDRAAFDLKPGQVSGVLESDGGYHILKVLERKGGVLEPFDKVKDRAREIVFARKRGTILSGIVRALKSTAAIERLAG